MRTFRSFYRKYHTVKVTHITPHTDDKILLPTDSVMHLVGMEKGKVGPTEEELSQFANLGFIHNVITLDRTINKPKYLKRFSTMKNEIRQLSGSFKLVTSDINYITRPVFLNYFPINSLYKYRETLSKNVAMWENMLYTLVENINKLEIDGMKNHFIRLNYVDADFSFGRLRKISRYNNVKLSKEISSFEEYVILDIYRLSNEEPSILSLIGKDTNISFVYGSYNKNIIFLLNLFEDINSVLQDGLSIVETNKAIRKNITSKIFDTFKIQENNDFIEDEVIDDEAEEIYKIEDKKEEIEKKIQKPIKEKEDVYKPRTYRKVLKDKLETLYEDGLVDRKKYNQSRKQIKKGKVIATELKESSVVTKEDRVVKPREVMKDEPYILDKSMLLDSTSVYDNQYRTVIMDKHINGVFNSVQRAGVIITKMEKENQTNVLGEHDIYTLGVTLVDGSPSTIRIKLPVVNSDNNFVSNGSSYKLRKQKVDMPIRKIAPNITSLSSYYGKLFVSRSKLVVDDLSLWIIKELSKRTSGDNPVILNLVNVFDNSIKTPSIYGKMASYVSKITMGTLFLSFNYNDRSSILSKGDSLKTIEKKGTLVGKFKRSGYIVVDDNDIFYRYGTPNEKIGSILDILELDKRRAPKEVAVVKVMGKQFYVGLVLSYLMSLSTLLKTLKVKVKLHSPNTRLPHSSFAIKFNDVKLEISNISATAEYILNGFLKMQKIIKDYDYLDFDKKDIYPDVFEHKGGMMRHVKELDLLDELFIDPMTAELLTEIKEPDIFIPLMIRAVELLTTEDHPDTSDGSVTVIRGYERFPGTIYSELVKSIRAYRIQITKRRKKIEMSPFAVSGAIMSDSSKKIVEDTNPVQYLKENEAVTISGTGGRSKDTMTISSRKYHINDVGVLSESNPDSSDVGMTSFLTINPNIKNTLGVTSSVDKLDDDKSKYYSTTYALTPGLELDDPKRQNFSSIMNSHVIAIESNEPAVVRTGYENILPYRVGKLFAFMATQNGVVTESNKDGIRIKYVDGSTDSGKLGIEYGKAEGSYYPNELVTKLSKGDRFKEGDPITWNANFFEEDTFNVGKLIYKPATYLKAALYEDPGTYEDSCVLDVEIANKMVAKFAKVTSSTLEFDQDIRNLVKINEKVNVGDKLFTIEEELTSSGAFKDSVLDNLAELTGQSVKAKYKGYIENIEVFYHGDKKDMSNSIRTLVGSSDRRMKKKGSYANKSFNGSVDSEYRIGTKPLQLNSLEIKIYIVVKDSVSNADKLILGNQLKCTVSDTISNLYTESGEKIDVGFGYVSVGARIVNAFLSMNMINTILRKLPNKLFSIYKGN